MEKIIDEIMEKKKLQLSVKELEIIHGMALVNHQSLVSSPVEFKEELEFYSNMINKIENTLKNNDMEVTRNEKGQFMSKSENNLVIKHDITLIRSGFKAEIKRVGQQKAGVGNKIIVSCAVEGIEYHEGFNSRIFGINLSSCYGFQSAILNGTYESENYTNSKEVAIRNETTTKYESTKWADAFRQAIEYFNTECQKYEDLVSEREQALIDAE